MVHAHVQLFLKTFALMRLIVKFPRFPIFILRAQIFCHFDNRFKKINSHFVDINVIRFVLDNKNA